MNEGSERDIREAGGTNNSKAVNRNLRLVEIKPVFVRELSTNLIPTYIPFLP